MFETEVFTPIIRKIDDMAVYKMNHNNAKSFRIIADHMRASVFILGDERSVVPSNIDQGYILRRYIRRSIR
ncbi:MAG: alanine--tRNA ligase-related protein, partial [Microcystaceae cyanobacterium]